MQEASNLHSQTDQTVLDVLKVLSKMAVSEYCGILGSHWPDLI